MENTGEIYITISNQMKEGGGGGGDKPEKEKKSKYDLFSSYMIGQAINCQKQMIQTLINNSISQIGNFTGSYETQQNVQCAIQLGNQAYNLGRSAFAGFKVGGVVGGLVAVTTSVATMGLDKAINITNNIVNNYKQNRNNAHLRMISGLDYLNNGSR